MQFWFWRLVSWHLHSDAGVGLERYWLGLWPWIRHQWPRVEHGSMVKPQNVIFTWSPISWQIQRVQKWHTPCFIGACCTLIDVVRLLIPEVLASEFKFISPPKNLTSYGTRASADFFLPKSRQSSLELPPPYQSQETIEYSLDRPFRQDLAHASLRFLFESVFSIF